MQWLCWPPVRVFAALLDFPFAHGVNEEPLIALDLSINYEPVKESKVTLSHTHIQVYKGIKIISRYEMKISF